MGSRGTILAWPTSGAPDRRCSRNGTAAGVLITGAGGQLGRSLAETFPASRALTRPSGTSSSRCRTPRRRGSSCTRRPGPTSTARRTSRRRRPRSTSAVRSTPRRSARRSSTSRRDYVSTAEGEPYVESDSPARSPSYGRTKLHGEAARARRRGSCAARGSSGRSATTSCVRCYASARSATRSRSSTTSAARPPSPCTSPRRSTRSSTCRSASTTSRPEASARGRSSPRRSSRRPVSIAACGGSRPPSSAPGAAPGVLGAALGAGAPSLPHWREGLRACLARIV